MCAPAIRDRRHREKIMRYLSILLLGVLLSNAVWAEDHAHQKSSPAPQSPAPEPFQKEMNEGMEKMMHDMHARGYTGNPDIDFLNMMIPHHQGAIEMARLVLVYGRDPITRMLAEEIIASQQVEIDAMKKRLSILRSRKATDPEEFPALGGTRGRTEPSDGGQKTVPEKQ